MAKIGLFFFILGILFTVGGCMHDNLPDHVKNGETGTSAFTMTGVGGIVFGAVLIIIDFHISSTRR